VKLESNKGQLKHLQVHSLPKEPKGKIIFFWDTSFVVDALFPPAQERIKELKQKKCNNEQEEELHKLELLMHKHDVAVEFMEKLVQESVNIAFSSILFTEIFFYCQHIELDKIYKDRKKTQEALKKNPKILSAHLAAIMKNWGLFMDLLSKFKNRIFAITPSDPDIIEETLRIRTTYELSHNDSLHIGTILAGKKKDIVVFDRLFKDVALKEGLNVWWKV